MYTNQQELDGIFDDLASAGSKLLVSGGALYEKYEQLKAVKRQRATLEKQQKMEAMALKAAVDMQALAPIKKPIDYTFYATLSLPIIVGGYLLLKKRK